MTTTGELANSLKRPDKYSFIFKDFTSNIKLWNSQYEVILYDRDDFITTNIDTTNGPKKTFSRNGNSDFVYHYYKNSNNTFIKLFIDLNDKL